MTSTTSLSSAFCQSLMEKRDGYEAPGLSLGGPARVLLKVVAANMKARYFGEVKTARGRMTFYLDPRTKADRQKVCTSVGAATKGRAMVSSNGWRLISQTVTGRLHLL